MANSKSLKYKTLPTRSELEMKFVSEGRGFYRAQDRLSVEDILGMAQQLARDIHDNGTPPITSPSLTMAYLNSLLRGVNYEVLGVIVLDNQNRPLGDEIVQTGTIDGASIYPRQIVEHVFKYKTANSVIIYHNHPSGNPEPSRADRDITDRLVQALGLIDVRVLDHMVIGEGYSNSFAELGYL